MPLFQKSVVNNFLKQLDLAELKIAYNNFLKFYGDKERIQNIRLLKEENYQEGFLREIFVQVLGYTINPDKNYNLTTEFKNETDSKKADGAILQNGKAVGVIELKSTKTPNLESIKEQAFSYKNNQSKCRYVITSNFEKLRFYIDNATEWEEFNLFELDFERFKTFYLFLGKENIVNGITANLKKESLLHEENVTDNLYKDYSKFKKDIFENLIKNNPGKDKLLLFHKSQKLLDRILFVLFAEDSGLVPPNAISRIIEQWQTFKKLDEPVSLYSRFAKLFLHLDIGHKYDSWEIPAYNGGLFKKDDLLDNLIIDDEILEKQSLKLSNYDFNSEVDVNILGHIFEHSISEIEQVEAEIEGTESDKEKSRRKKEGIFYTPKYITKYIVENTVGTLCEEKKKELNIDFIENEIIENSRTAKGKLTQKAKELLGRLDEYRKYLLSLKILDPACGSGAFLNQALEFLINEHQMLDSYQKEIFQESILLPNISKSILENNLYGVDINEESIEIAKLSLWLRTAEKGRKLSDLNNNIKCGNSLIDDPDIAGDKAFNWEKEFPEIMNAGGFDIVIGNPPYVRGDRITIFKKYLSNHYKCYTSSNDLYAYFYEKGMQLLNNSGLLCFISSNKFIKSNYGKNLRKVLSNYTIKEILDFGELAVFNDAATFPVIFKIFKPKTEQKIKYLQIKNLQFDSLKNLFSKDHIEISQKNINNEKWDLFGKDDNHLIKKIKSNNPTLQDYLNKPIKFGIKTGLNKAFIIEQNLYNKFVKSNPDTSKLLKKFLDGDDVRKYHYNFNHKYLILFKKGWTNINFPEALTEKDKWLKIKQKYPEICFYLEKFESKARKRSDQGDYWWELRTCDYYKDFEKPKILYPDIAKESRFTIDKNNFYPNATLFEIPREDYYLLALLNSKLIWYYLSNICPVIGDPQRGGRLRLKTIYLKNLPIKDSNNKLQFESNSKYLLDLYKKQNEKIFTFLSRITSNFPIEKLSNKLKEFYNYDFKTFLSELKKKKVTLTLKQQDEWEEYFNEYKTEINELQAEISKTDNEIDCMVYRLYGLTEEEIKIVEENVIT